MTWNKEFSKNIIKLRKLSSKFTGGFVVYSGDLTPGIDHVKFINFKSSGEIVS